MKVLIASDSFKGCMTSMQANTQIAAGIHQADPDVDVECFAISDGGEGMVDAFMRAFDAQLYPVRTCDLYGRSLKVRWAYDPTTRIGCIEAASMLGVTLYPHGERKPLQASSYGLGKACRQILAQKKVDRLIIGLGGTGTNDGGMGFAQAFGVVFYDRNRKPLEACAANLAKIAFIDKRSFTPPASGMLEAACDVSNRLLGPKGATHVFGKQKGLRPQQVLQVEKGMQQLRDKLDQTFHVDVNAFASSGAAGGLGAMLIGVFKADCRSGVDILMEAPRLRQALETADYVITGEGQSDAQSASGKVVSRVGEISRSYGKPCICICGALADGYEKLYEQGIDAIFATADRAMSFVFALRHGPQKLAQEAYNVMKLILTVERRCFRK